MKLSQLFHVLLLPTYFGQQRFDFVAEEVSRETEIACPSTEDSDEVIGNHVSVRVQKVRTVVDDLRKE